MDYMDMLSGNNKRTNTPVVQHSFHGRMRVNAQHTFIEAETDITPATRKQIREEREIMDCFRQDRYGKSR